MENEVASKPKLIISYRTRLPAQHKYFSTLNNKTGSLTDVYTNPKHPNKHMAKFINPEDNTECYISTKYLDITAASIGEIELYLLPKLMDKVIDLGLSLPLQVIKINPFKDNDFKKATLIYVSDKENKVVLSTADKASQMQPIEHHKHTLFALLLKKESGV
jgi:hypothetical protein